MNAKLIHKWLRDPQFAPEEDTGEVLNATAAALLPVEIAEAVPIMSPSDMQVSTKNLTEPVSAQRVDITLSDGRRTLVDGTTALSGVLSVVDGLMP